VFTNPEMFDPKRTVRKHLAFGSGIHACIGAIIARAMARILFEEIALSMKGIEPAGPAVRSHGVIRGFDTMPLRFVRRG
jgi:cytochrome P450